jgi:Na+-transporting NADH:ubiquinone oxidoreductase subunit A
MKIRIITISKGLSLPITGQPDQVISGSKQVGRVAVLGIDYVGMKPQFLVSVGDDVQLGQPLFVDKKIPSIQYTSPGSGKVVEINRGEKRRLLSVIIQLKGDDEVTFQSYAEHELSTLDRQKVVSLLLVSGLWTSIRARPFSKVANPDTTPHSLFINTMDTNPLAPSVEMIMKENERHFVNGLTVLSRLTEGKVFLCKAPGESIPSCARTEYPLCCGVFRSSSRRKCRDTHSFPQSGEQKQACLACWYPGCNCSRDTFY